MSPGLEGVDEVLGVQVRWSRDDDRVQVLGREHLSVIEIAPYGCSNSARLLVAQQEAVGDRHDIGAIEAFDFAHQCRSAPADANHAHSEVLGLSEAGGSRGRCRDATEKGPA